MCCEKQEPGGPCCSRADCRMRCAHSIITFGSLNIILQCVLVGYNYTYLTVLGALFPLNAGLYISVNGYALASVVIGAAGFAIDILGFVQGSLK